MDNDVTIHSDKFMKGAEAERAAAVAYLKAKARQLDSEDSEGNRAAIDALCSVIAVIRHGHHWLK